MFILFIRFRSQQIVYHRFVSLPINGCSNLSFILEDIGQLVPQQPRQIILFMSDGIHVRYTYHHVVVNLAGAGRGKWWCIMFLVACVKQHIVTFCSSGSRSAEIVYHRSVSLAVRGFGNFGLVLEDIAQLVPQQPTRNILFMSDGIQVRFRYHHVVVNLAGAGRSRFLPFSPSVFWML